MELLDYQLLIQSLPVRQQCFVTRRSTWQNYEENTEWLNMLNNELFNEQETLKISREDVFGTVDLRAKIVKSVYWGYPRGMRGNNFIGILNNINILIDALNALLELNNPEVFAFQQFVESTNHIHGLGLSTYSKILYFSNVQFNFSHCLILDKRLMDVFNENIFDDFEFPILNTNNITTHYLNYISRMNELANEFGTNGDNIEQFLFIFGNNIKEQ